MLRFYIQSTLIAVAGLLSISLLRAQTSQQIPVSLDWAPAPVTVRFGGEPVRVWKFKGAKTDESQPQIPVFSERILLPEGKKINVKLINREEEAFDPQGAFPSTVHQQPVVTVIYEMERHEKYARILVTPVYQSGGQYKRLKRFTLDITPSGGYYDVAKSRDTPTYHSKLEDGTLYKIAVTQGGIYKLDASFLKDLGVNLSEVDPRNIHILGNGGGRLPELIAAPRIDDLAENAIYVAGEADGQFDEGDFILFYSAGAEPVRLASSATYRIVRNPYSDKAYYFLKIDNVPGKRVADRATLPAVNHVVNEYLSCQKHESDLVNLLDEHISSEGGGNEWFGELFKANGSLSFGDKFYFPQIIQNKEALLRVRFAGKSYTPTPFSMTVDGESFNSIIDAVAQGPWEDMAVVKTYTQSFLPQGPQPSITLTYQPQGIEAAGRLDYIEVNAWQRLEYPGEPFTFGTLGTGDEAQRTFEVTNTSGRDLTVWDVTNPLVPVNQLYEKAGSKIRFTTDTDSLRSFAVFSTGDGFLTPEPVGSIPNQNLHGIDRADLIVVYHPSLKGAAEKIALHRMQYSGMQVAMVNVEQIYNEFSSGALDPTAIRDFAKMVYDRDPQFRYLLLMGDGSFDHKNIKNNPNNYNLIPVRETERGIGQLTTFPSDDFYGLLSDDEGTSNLAGAMDIAVGRITARTEEEADAIVEKIIFYDSDPSGLKPWRTRITCLGDDGDGNLHQRQTNETIDYVEAHHKEFNGQKILLDAFPQVPDPYGERVPEATKQINDAVLDGTLVLNYFGHGGAKGLAQERVLTLQSIKKWKNIKDRLPLVITASCSTSGFDDPSIKTFGEELLKNPTGGAVGLFSTVRPVYASDNEALIDATFPYLFMRENGRGLSIGEVLRRGKNSAGISTKTRKFLLLGDPSMPLAIPQSNVVVTDKVNGVEMSTADSVVLQSLNKVTIEGHIADAQGQLLDDFNGRLYVTIYDKMKQYQTLGQDAGPYPYKARKGIIFKGQATVTGGHFSFSFVVPKDVVSHGYGKISYYATDLQSRDAAGYSEKVYIGGPGGTAVQDDVPPVIRLYMNDESFVSGGITDSDPKVYAILTDDNGINISGSGVGHDLTVKLDEELKVANNYYETQADDYTTGFLNYPLENVPEGEHTVEVKAWDVANNPATAAISFVVADSPVNALAHVLNYPNPFTDKTRFQFEHGFSGPFRVRIDIFSIDGRLVKSIDKEILPKGYRVTDISWDGKDDFGGQLARGVYVYRVKLISSEDPGKKAVSGFEKLVILK